MTFDFELVPLGEIEPWGSDAGKPCLSWFALSLGAFWITVGDQEVFQYSQRIREHWMTQFPAANWPAHRYDVYQIERSCTTLLEMLPLILDPIPDDLAALVADEAGWIDWETLAEAWSESHHTEVENADDIYYCALTWWWHRKWDAGYLAHPPSFALWRAGDEIHIRWDNRDITVEGIPVWEATAGEVTVSVADFIEAAASFHARFLGAMQTRVDTILEKGGVPGVAIDLDQLARTQGSRLNDFAHAVNPWAAQARRLFTRDEIRAAMRTITDGVAFSAG